MSTRDPPSPADGPARDVFATARHGQHGLRKHTRRLVPSPSLSLSGERPNTGAVRGGKSMGLASIFNPITRG